MTGEITEELELKEDEIAVRVIIHHSKLLHPISVRQQSSNAKIHERVGKITSLSMQCTTIDTLCCVVGSVSRVRI